MNLLKSEDSNVNKLQILSFVLRAVDFEKSENEEFLSEIIQSHLPNALSQMEVDINGQTFRFTPENSYLI